MHKSKYREKLLNSIHSSISKDGGFIACLHNILLCTPVELICIINCHTMSMSICPSLLPVGLVVRQGIKWLVTSQTLSNSVYKIGWGLGQFLLLFNLLGSWGHNFQWSVRIGLLGSISTTGTLTVWRNDGKCKYSFLKEILLVKSQVSHTAAHHGLVYHFGGPWYHFKLFGYC